MKDWIKVIALMVAIYVAAEIVKAASSHP